MGVVVLLAATTVLYLWHITVNGMGNAFYAAAAQSGSSDWKALLFGSLDAANFITVDKPPLSQWVMGLSGRVFGFSSASMLIPQAVMAVAAVALLYGAVARVSGPRAGLLAGTALALTPVAALMFRFNDPDAAMVLLMTAAAYCTVRALRGRGARWLAFTGLALGLAFLAKMLEGLMVAPALAAAYLLAAPVPMRTRLLHLFGGAASFAASTGWFVLLTIWWPASSRPYLAGSTDNSFMDLVLGYNGMARVFGRHQEVWPGTRLGAVFDHGIGYQGWTRLFRGELGFEIGWLVPAALLAMVLVLFARRGVPRTDPVRAAVVLFGGWLVVVGLVLSYMHGTLHPYYSLAIAPAVAAMFAIGAQQTWARRDTGWCRTGLVAMLLVTGVWSWWLLGRNAAWLPWLRWSILAVTVITSLALPVVLATRRYEDGRRVVAALAGVAVAGALAGPGAYALATVGTAHQGVGPSVGPPRASLIDGLWGRALDDRGLDELLAGTHTRWSAAVERSSSAATLELASRTAVMAIGGFSGIDPAPTLRQFQDDVAAHRVAYYVATRTAGHLQGWTAHRHSDIAEWVAANFRAQAVGEAIVYDLSSPKGAVDPPPTR